MRQVVASLVVVEAGLPDPLLAGVLESPAVGALRLSVFIVAVDADESSGAVGQRNDAAPLVRSHEAAIRGAGPLILDDRLVDAGTEDEAPLQNVAAVIFGDSVDAVIREPSRCCAG